MEEIIKEELQHFLNIGYNLEDAKYMVLELVKEILNNQGDNMTKLTYQEQQELKESVMDELEIAMESIWSAAIDLRKADHPLAKDITRVESILGNVIDELERT